MRTYRGPEGDERLWFEPSEIEEVMEDELRKGSLMPTSDGAAVDVEAFIETHLRATLDQHADLDRSVLGVTEFRSGVAPLVRINRDLTGSAMDDEWCPPGILGRWRATLAHEASHIVLHRMLFELNPDQIVMFDDAPSSGALLFRCLKREVSYRSPARDWKEIQANRGMAALLMPRTVFVPAARQELAREGDLRGATNMLARRFQVSREAAEIRLATFGFRAEPSGSRLL